MISSILVCAEHNFNKDYSIDRYDVRSLVKGYLDHYGKKVGQFKNSNMPVKDWANGFYWD